MSDDGGAASAYDKPDALVIGAGPAGLMAADVLSEGGASVLLAEAMPTVGRKFLMAGKSGLNLTRDERLETFLARFNDADPRFLSAVRAFGPAAVRAWAEDLGEPVFTGSTGRVFPDAMKASPLLRRWVTRLENAGVDRRVKWRWTGWSEDKWVFETSAGSPVITPKVAVLALGGGSWRRLGSDGQWQDLFASEGIACAPFSPSNIGLAVQWSNHMEEYFGVPVKGTALCAGRTRTRGEWVITQRGMEGGGVYDIARDVSLGHALTLDVIPDFTIEKARLRLQRARGKASLSNHLRKTLRLDGVRRALAVEWGRPLPDDADGLAETLKALAVPTTGTMPFDEAISTAGGVDWSALNGFALKVRPDTFCAGEMLDWDAPTGGYLLTGCLATGRAAALQALAAL